MQSAANQSPIHPIMSASISVRYAALAAAGKIERDDAQEAIVGQLAQLERRLAEHRLARKSSSLGWLFGARARDSEPVTGLYIFGDVGRGKTMLMDLFFEASPWCANVASISMNSWPMCTIACTCCDSG